jgi:hypothetical protein
VDLNDNNHFGFVLAAITVSVVGGAIVLDHYTDKSPATTAAAPKVEPTVVADAGSGTGSTTDTKVADVAPSAPLPVPAAPAKPAPEPKKVAEAPKKATEAPKKAPAMRDPVVIPTRSAPAPATAAPPAAASIPTPIEPTTTTSSSTISSAIPPAPVPAEPTPAAAAPAPAPQTAATNSPPPTQEGKTETQ